MIKAVIHSRVLIFLGKLVLLLSSVIVTVTVLILALNFYLAKFWTVDEYLLMLWRLDYAHFSPSYIFWAKSYCETHPDCTFREEEIVANKVLKYGDCTMDDQPLRAVFIGDSFTMAPWTEDDSVYASVFAQRLAESSQNCVQVMRLATHATGSQMQFARFLDVVSELKPDLVVWQFYFNDMNEDRTYSLFEIKNDKLVRRKQWFHGMVIGGWINQLDPEIRTTGLGKYLLHAGETKDIFRTWDTNENTAKERIKMAETMNEVSKNHNFTWFSTLSPLECELTKSACYDADKEQQMLLSFLKENTPYVSMYEVASPSAQTDQELKIDNPLSLFNTTEDPAVVGWRHLSVEGNVYAGNVLFENYKVASLSAEIEK